MNVYSHYAKASLPSTSIGKLPLHCLCKPPGALSDTLAITYEHTMQTQMQIPRPVLRDYGKWAENEGRALRFGARMVAPLLNAFDGERG